MEVTFAEAHRNVTYVLGYALPWLKLALEIEDPRQDDILHQLMTMERNARLASLGWRILTFASDDVLKRPSGVRLLLLSEIVGLESSIYAGA
jgi:very-short-patch-repair endonuclease